MRIQYTATRNKPVKASRRPIKAEDELMDDMPVVEDAGELLFEATDVADLLAEVTGEDVNMDMDDDVVVFTIGEDEYTVEPEGDEEVLEATRRPLRGKKPVAANKRTAPARRPAPTRRPAVKASTKPAAKPSVRRK